MCQGTLFSDWFQTNKKIFFCAARRKSSDLCLLAFYVVGELLILSSKSKINPSNKRNKKSRKKTSFRLLFMIFWLMTWIWIWIFMTMNCLLRFYLHKLFPSTKKKCWQEIVTKSISFHFFKQTKCGRKIFSNFFSFHRAILYLCEFKKNPTRTERDENMNDILPRTQVKIGGVKQNIHQHNTFIKVGRLVEVV